MREKSFLTEEADRLDDEAQRVQEAEAEHLGVHNAEAPHE